MFAKPIKTLFCLGAGLFLTGSTAFAATGNAPFITAPARTSTPAEIEAADKDPKLTQLAKEKVPEAKVLRRMVVDMTAAGAKFEPPAP